MSSIRQLAAGIRKLRGQKFMLEKRESVLYRELQKKLCDGCLQGVRCWETDVMNCLWKRGIVKGPEITVLLKRALRPKRKPNIRKWAERLAKDTDVND